MVFNTMQNFQSSILAALRTAKEQFGSVAALAAKTGVNPVTLGRWLNGERNPTVVEIGKVFDALSVKLNLSSQTIPSPFSAYSFIPKYSAVAGAGESFETEAELQGMYAFRTDFLQREHINPKASAMLLVRGDSMEPLIKDGDTILIDQSDNLPKDGLIYAAALGDALMVKRFQRLPDGWRLRSENPDRGYTDVTGDDFLDMLKVHGRVRWFGRVL